MNFDDEFLYKVLKKLPTDYKDYGGKVDRWDHPEEYYPDCQSCSYHIALEAPYTADWGVCTNPHSKRAGLLTFEHQAGMKCHSSMLQKPRKQKMPKKRGKLNDRTDN